MTKKIKLSSGGSILNWRRKVVLQFLVAAAGAVLLTFALSGDVAAQDDPHDCNVNPDPAFGCDPPTNNTPIEGGGCDAWCALKLACKLVLPWPASYVCDLIPRP